MGNRKSRRQILCGRRGMYFPAVFFLLALTSNSDAQFTEISSTDITVPPGTTDNTFGYIGQTTTVTGAGSTSSTLSGYTVTSSGNGSDTVFFLYNPSNETATGAVVSPTPYSVSVSGLTVTNGLSQGGSAVVGGGGAGLGGGAFVGAGVTLTLSNVDVTGNRAIGGSTGGSAVNGGGGGGIGGNSSTSSLTIGGGLFVNGGGGGAGTPGGFGEGGGGNTSGGAGSMGGFGGGAGYSENSTGAAGGFGGGGSGGNTEAGDGGVGGGNGAITDSGGSGAGLGGGLFVQTDGTVIVTGSSTISGNSVMAGTVSTSGYTGGTQGAAAGADIFMMTGGSVTLAPGTTTVGMATTPNTVTIGASADDASSVVSDVADDSVYSLPTGQSYTAGNGAGAALAIGNGTTPGGLVILHGNNTYAGGTSITNGTTLEIFQDDNLGAYDSAHPTTVGELTLSGGGELLTTPSAGDGGGTAFTTSRDISITDGGTLAALTGTTATYNGVISGTTGALTTGDASGNNDGTVVLTGANTYGGGTTIESGTLETENNTALGTGVNSAVTVDSGASLEVTTGLTIANNITISGTGINNAGAITTTGGNNATFLTGSMTLAADASLQDPADAVLEIEGPVILGAHTLSTGGSNVEYSGVISGTGGAVTVTSGFVLMNGSSANTYSGLTTVDSGAILGLVDSGGVSVPGNLDITGQVNDDRSGQLATTSVVTLNGSGNLFFTEGGISETVAGLNSTSALTSVTESDLGALPDTITLDGTGMYSYAGTLSDSFSSFVTFGLVKDGSGTQILTGANTYSGGTTIEDGVLAVGTASGTTSTALGAGNVMLTGGTLTTSSPNTGLAIDVGGNYSQGNTSTLTLNFYGANNYDSLDLTTVGKTATLGGTLNLVFNTPTFVPGKGEQFTVVTTLGGITMPVSALYLNPETNLAAYKLLATGMLTNNDDDFVVTVTPSQQDFSTLFGGNYLNPNQLSVAHNLDSYINNVPVGGNYSALITALDQLSGNPNSLGAGFNELMPLNFANFASSTAFNNTSFFTQQMDNYFANHRGSDGNFVASAGGIDYSGLTLDDSGTASGLQQIHSRLLAWNPAPSTGLLSDSSESAIGGVDMKDSKNASGQAAADANRWNIFVSGDAVLAQDFSDPSSSEAHEDTTTGAMQLGVDYAITPHFLVGALFGYGHTDADTDNIGSTASVDTYSPGVYASFSDHGWYANALGSYGFSDYTQHRNIDLPGIGGTARSNPDGDQIVGNLDGGYDFHSGAWTFGPTAGIQYVHLEVNGYDESGLTAGNLSVNDNQADSLRSRLGGRINYVLQHDGIVFTPHFAASWQHEFLDQSRGVTSQFDGLGAGSFVVTTQNPSRDSALLDTGLDAELNKTVTVFTDYTVQAGQANYFGQSIQAGVKIGF
jgi:fibronectin-binding autotransporter adhesin